MTIYKPTRQNLEKATNLLASDELIGLPTETVYGLAGNALSEEAIQKIYQLKGRPTTNPLIAHFDCPEKINKYLAPLSEFQQNAFNQLKVFWPGPLTIILPKNNLIPDIATAGKGSIAVRVPNHKVALELLSKLDFPLVAPSANRSNYISPTCARHVSEEFGDQLPLILDGDSSEIGLESTVISLLNDQAIILRPGAITYEQLKKIILEVQENLKIIPVDQTQRSPGQQSKHYSPRTKLAFLQNYPTPYPERTGLICFSGHQGITDDFAVIKTLSDTHQLPEVAARLFDTMRELDKLALDLILIDSCPEQDLGRAIMDRLKRAVSTDDE